MLFFRKMMGGKIPRLAAPVVIDRRTSGTVAFPRGAVSVKIELVQAGGNATATEGGSGGDYTLSEQAIPKGVKSGSVSVGGSNGAHSTFSATGMASVSTATPTWLGGGGGTYNGGGAGGRGRLGTNAFNQPTYGSYGGASGAKRTSGGGAAGPFGGGGGGSAGGGETVGSGAAGGASATGFAGGVRDMSNYSSGGGGGGIDAIGGPGVDQVSSTQGGRGGVGGSSGGAGGYLSGNSSSGGGGGGFPGGGGAGGGTSETALQGKGAAGMVRLTFT